MSISVYICSPLSQAQPASRLAKLLTLRGLEVVSSWHEAKDESDPIEPRKRAEVLEVNLADMRKADAAVVYIPAGIGRTTYGEAGWFLATGRPVVWCVAQESSRSILDADRLSAIAEDEDDVSDALIRKMKDSGYEHC